MRKRKKRTGGEVVLGDASFGSPCRRPGFQLVITKAKSQNHKFGKIRLLPVRWQDDYPAPSNMCSSNNFIID